MANNETYTCSPSEVCLSNSDSELLIPTPWSDESKNEERAKRWREEFEWKRSLFEINFMFGINAFDLDKDTDVMKDKGSKEHVCETEVPLNNKIRKQSGDNVSDKIDGGKGKQVPNPVVKKVLQVEYADMEGQMLQLIKEIKKSQNNACFWKSTAIVLGVVASFMFVMN
ncbi:hypothetical protein Tco_0895789 [Tanacetum coccineum]|uniref:Uncharacterized protein n=1 Tax=Tanacetum coccineum TaxID=301880 RepID=A0ABQ5CH23_9ASTR